MKSIRNLPLCLTLSGADSGPIMTTLAAFVAANEIDAADAAEIEQDLRACGTFRGAGAVDYRLTLAPAFETHICDVDAPGEPTYRLEADGAVWRWDADAAFYRLGISATEAEHVRCIAAATAARRLTLSR